MRSSTLFSGFVVAAMTLLTCRAEPANLLFGLRLVPVEVRVVDNATTHPVAGAVVQPLCLGGTPYPTNSYRTDTNGIARVMAFETIAAVRVTMNGYQEGSFAFLSTNAFVSTNGVFTNAVVRLKRVEM